MPSVGKVIKVLQKLCFRKVLVRESSLYTGEILMDKESVEKGRRETWMASRKKRSLENRRIETEGVSGRAIRKNFYGTAIYRRILYSIKELPNRVRCMRPYKKLRGSKCHSGEIEDQYPKRLPALFLSGRN